MSYRVGFVLVIAALLLVAILVFAFTGKAYSVGDKERGYASWYNDGMKTASGETFSPTKFTAAHRQLPLGTVVRVTNRENGQSVEVRINDRGPWRGGRIIDLSAAAADALKMKKSGAVLVEIEVIHLGVKPKHKGWWW